MPQVRPTAQVRVSKPDDHTRQDRNNGSYRTLQGQVQWLWKGLGRGSSGQRDKFHWVGGNPARIPYSVAPRRAGAAVARVRIPRCFGIPQRPLLGHLNAKFLGPRGEFGAGQQVDLR